MLDSVAKSDDLIKKEIGVKKKTFFVPSSFSVAGLVFMPQNAKQFWIFYEIRPSLESDSRIINSILTDLKSDQEDLNWDNWR